MSSSILRRLIVVLALCAFLGAPATSLAGPRSSARFSEDRTVSASLLSRLWNAVVSAWEKEGCTIDPYGRCAPKSQTTTDNGCTIDPFGRCLTDTQDSADAGCSADPYGRCLPVH
jgi:hypothetical protein